MRGSMLAGVAAMAMALSAEAVAQSVAVEIAPEQRTRIKEYVVKEKVRPYATRERIAIGATLPAEVELHAVPSDWGPSVSRYRYVYSDDRVYFVDPSSRRVVYDID